MSLVYNTNQPYIDDRRVKKTFTYPFPFSFKNEQYSMNGSHRTTINGLIQISGPV